MKPKEFVDKFTGVLDEINSNRHKENFVQNMININNDVDYEFAEWASIYLAWSELSTKDDIRRYYGYLDDEDTNEED